MVQYRRVMSCLRGRPIFWEKYRNGAVPAVLQELQVILVVLVVVINVIKSNFLAL